MTVFSYKSPIGDFMIKPLKDGRWGLWFENEYLNAYRKPEYAAEDVRNRSTGSHEWDDKKRNSINEADIPFNIFEWKESED